ncbi:MAG TPA: C39 family peptidase [Anaerolineaceae bacterium]|nr:C39 family peptidase [Anaerolineaceae bacterium]
MNATPEAITQSPAQVESTTIEVANLPSLEAGTTPELMNETPDTSNMEVLATQTVQITTSLNYPDSYYIKGIVGHVQVYELGCEASAAVDWANYFGKTIYESNFQAELPVSDNPDFGYVGDPNTDGWGQIPPYAYGVHSEPVAALLMEYGLPAQSKKGYTLEDIRQKIGESKPVIVWIIGNMEYSVPVEYIDSQGRKSIVAPYEHVVILTGYDENSVRYMSNGRFFDVPNNVFLTSWAVLGNLAVVHE